jgi:hypothetical protein
MFEGKVEAARAAISEMTLLGCTSNVVVNTSFLDMAMEGFGSNGE